MCAGIDLFPTHTPWQRPAAGDRAATTGKATFFL